MKFDPRRLAALLVLAVGLAIYAQIERRASVEEDRPPGITETATAIDALFRERASGVMVESSGVVTRILEDDEEGSRHQRFIVRLASGTTVLIAHNIDLAPRAPVERGDPVEFRGEYEWNDRGGVVHWTHHDPRGERSGGWIRVRGETVR